MESDSDRPEETGFTEQIGPDRYVTGIDLSMVLIAYTGAALARMEVQAIELIRTLKRVDPVEVIMQLVPLAVIDARARLYEERGIMHPEISPAINLKWINQIRRRATNEKPGIKADYTNEDYFEIAAIFYNSQLSFQKFVTWSHEKRYLYKNHPITEWHLRKAIKTVDDFARSQTVGE